MKRALLIFFSVLLFSCEAEKKEAIPTAVPEHVVPEEIMVDVLVDLHMIEASLSLKMMEDHGVARDTSEFYNPYKKHNITRKAFEESFLYYANQPQQLNAMYEEVLNRLNQKHVEVMKNLPKDSTGKPIVPAVDPPGEMKYKPSMIPRRQ